MIGLAFGLEKNVCGYIHVYSDSQGFFFLVGLPMDCRGGGGGGMGFGECTMDPGQNCVPSLKNTTNWANEFLVHSKKGEGLKVVG